MMKLKDYVYNGLLHLLKSKLSIMRLNMKKLML